MRPENVIDPPATFIGRFKYLGPGIVISAAVIGSGELIATTALGAKAGFALLWLVVISTGVKVWIQLELGQWTILTGKPALEGYAQVPPRFGRVGWIGYLWVLMDLAKILQRGGIIGSCVACLSLMLPVFGQPLSSESLIFWTVVTVVSGIALLVSGRYSVIERAAVVAVIVFTLSTVGLAVAIPFTDFSFGFGELVQGFSFTIPAGALGFAVAMFGITGVGADEMTGYTYWCLEKGYARYVGPEDGSEARKRRAHGWISVMRTDVLVSWVISTACTMAFYVIGAAILHPQGLVPEGNDLIITLSTMYTAVLGEGSRWIFLIGAFAVLYSTFISAVAGIPRLWANNLSVFGVYSWSNVVLRSKIIRAFTIVYPLIWGFGFLVVQSPLLMVQIGGVASGIFLVAVVVAVWYFRATAVPAEFKKSNILTVMLVFSSIAVFLLGIYTVLNTLGVTS